jgi:hypothetical protein
VFQRLTANAGFRAAWPTPLPTDAELSANVSSDVFTMRPPPPSHVLPASPPAPPSPLPPPTPPPLYRDPSSPPQSPPASLLSFIGNVELSTEISDVRMVHVTNASLGGSGVNAGLETRLLVAQVPIPTSTLKRWYACHHRSRHSHSLSSHKPSPILPHSPPPNPNRLAGTLCPWTAAS